ncbi:MAG: hypothetical protein QNJ72_30835 [Pleurocapsa sp. MO_226.B13]|nr:hypothetical protein [Pleurocapsa sp. MO_226.B13]
MKKNNPLRATDKLECDRPVHLAIAYQKVVEQFLVSQDFKLLNK